MCKDCGCSEPASARHAHAHDHGQAAAELSHNDRLAERNRGFFRAKRVFVVNLLSFASSGVRTFVERTLADQGPRRRIGLITAEFLEQIHAVHEHQHHEAHGHAHAHGPEADAHDRAHMDAHMIAHALDHLAWDGLEVLLIENGGSAACQAVYDLGETVRVALFSVRDGEFKPLKFPLFFDRAAAVVINEIDQAAAVGFDVQKARAHLRQVAPAAAVLETAPATGAGMAEWRAFLEAGASKGRGGA